MGVAETMAGIDRARDAVRRAAWAEAYDGLSALDPAGLTPRDLESFADAAWWLSKTDESIAARQKAYSGYADAGQDRRAAFVAGRLCIEHFFRGEPSIGSGWLMRAQRHLADQAEGVEHGFLALLEGTIARFSGELDGAMALERRAAEIGRRFGDRDLIAMAVHSEGVTLIAMGRVREGMALLDEAMTSVVAGELSAYFTGAVYCNVLEACLEVADVRRAREWSDAAKAWSESLPPESPFPGLCRIFRAEVASLGGAWPEAEAEAARASDELVGFSPAAAAGAFYEIGEIRRRVGNLAGAEEAFGRAHELGLDPQPGLALLRLAQGKVESAHNTLRLAVTGRSGNRLRRARLLAAQVEVAVAADELDVATRASDELDSIAGAFETPALDATASFARGALRLAEGDVSGALERLRHAVAIWQEVRLPYETARARMLYGIAIRESGNEEDAGLELRAALAAFERLGAIPDAARVTGLLSEPTVLPRGLTPREAEVLRLVATGRTNRDIAVELVLSEHTVARHLQNIFAKIEVTSRAAATAFAFEHGLV
ncbi:MAG: response regulator transcription factor [Actinomycetota bacterium]